jgi:hypothetical protein
VKRYSAETSWRDPPPWDWSLLLDIERFLLDRLSSDRGTQREIDVRDSHGDINATTIREARERIEHESTEPKELTLSIWTGPERAFEGRSDMAVIVRVDGHDDTIAVTVRFSGLDDAVARRLKVDFDAWRERRSAMITRSNPGKVVQSSAGHRDGLLTRQLQQQTAWWKPDIHNIRDNLLANIIWLLLIALAGVVVAWLRLH